MSTLLHKYREVILYLIFGVATTAVNYVVYFLFRGPFHISYMWSNLFAWFFSVLFAFVTNKRIVFRSQTFSFGAYAKEMGLFYWYRLLSLGIDMAMMYILIGWLHMNELIAKTITQVVIIVLNYVFSKLFIFKPTKMESKKE